MPVRPRRFAHHRKLFICDAPCHIVLINADKQTVKLSQPLFSLVKFFRLQKAERLGVTLQVGVLRLIVVRALVAIGAMQRQQIVQRGWLGLGKLSFYVLQPADQRGDFFFRRPQQRVGFPNETVEIALVGADALCFHLPESHTLMDGGELVNALSLIAAVVDPAIQFLFCILIAQISPRLPPMLQGVWTAPIGSRHSVEHIVSYFITDALSLLVKQIFPPLLVAPSAVFIQRTDRTHDMKVGI